MSSLGADELGRSAVNALLTRTGLDPALVDEVIFGCVAQPAEAANVARVLALRAGISESVPAGRDRVLFARHLRYAARTSRRPARAVFHALLRYGPKLEREQLLLGRFVDIGTELFAITATCSRAEQVLRDNHDGADPEQSLRLVDYFCRASRLRIEQKFRGLRRSSDPQAYRLGQQVLAGRRPGLTTGIVQPKR